MLLRGLFTASKNSQWLPCLSHTAGASGARSLATGGATTTGAQLGGSVLPRSVDTGGESYAASLAAMSSLLDDMRAEMEKVHAAGGEVAIKRHRARGKLLPRERIDALLDDGSPFLELSPLAGHLMYGELLLCALRWRVR